MDRTSDYNNFISLTQTHYSPPSTTFYDTLYKKLLNLEHSIGLHKKYVDILVIEEKYNKLIQEIHDIFHVIDIEMTEDESKHFEGIKHILNLRVNIINKKIKESKFNNTRIKVELEPEVAEKRVVRNFNSNPVIEQEHARLVERFIDTSMQSTRQRVLEIQEIQDLIGMHITAQSERIELLLGTTRDASDHIKKGGNYVKKDNGRYARRLLFLILLSMSFVLLFIHFFHRD